MAFWEESKVERANRHATCIRVVSSLPQVNDVIITPNYLVHNRRQIRRSVRLIKNPDDILYSSTSFFEIEIVVLTCQDPNARTWFFKIFSFSWLVMIRRNDILCVTDIVFSHPKYACVKRLNTKKMQCLKWMNNSDHGDCVINYSKSDQNHVVWYNELYTHFDWFPLTTSPLSTFPSLVI